MCDDQREEKEDRNTILNLSHPELRPRFLQGLGGRVQGPPLVCELGLPPLPALQEQGGPHHVEECKHHAADVPAGLKQAHQKRSYVISSPRHDYSCRMSQKLLLSPDPIRSASTARSR